MKSPSVGTTKRLTDSMHRTAQPRPIPRALLSLAGPALLAAVFAPGALAQERSDIAVRDEIEFARGLASEWGFIDLAQRVVDATETGEISQRMQEELALLECELYYSAAKRNSDRRNELLAEALDAYEEFVERRPYSELLPQAESQLVKVAGLYARSLSMSLDEAAGEEAETLRTKLQEVLDAAIEQSNKLISGLEALPRDERTEADSRRLHELLLNLGDMYLELAKTQDDPTFSFEQSNKAYEDLVDSAGEGEPAALQAFVGIGNNYLEQGEFLDAASFFEYVVELAVSKDDPEAWARAREEMSPAELEKRFLFMQLATGGLIDAYVKAGDRATAVEWGMHFYNTWKREGLNLQQPLGYMALLSVAESLTSAGGFIGGSWAQGEGQWFATREEMDGKFNRRDQNSALDIALTMAQQANDDNKGNTLQIRAQKVINEIISRPGVEVDPEILFEAAMGSYNARDWGDAVESFKRVLASLEHADSVKRTEIGPKLMWHMGRSYQRLDRLFEASATFQVALERFSGDPQYDQDNAKGFFETMRVLKGRHRGDEYLDALFTTAQDTFAEYSASAAEDIEYGKADAAYQAGDYAEAKKLYENIGVLAQAYEKARVFSGVCAYKLKDYDGAIAIFDAYINQYLTDPTNTLPPGPKQARRREAEATAWFYWGLTEFVLADAGKGDWQNVIDKLLDYETRFEGQSGYAPAAMYRVMIAYDRLDKRPEARAIYEKMLQVFPDSRWTGSASAESYRSLKARYDAEEDEAKKTAILREMAENLQVLNRTAAAPSYSNMKAEAGHWMDLGEYETAEALYESALAKFGDGDLAEDIDKFVLPPLGEAYLRLEKPQQAADALARLVDEKKATRPSAQVYGRALAGWVEYVGGDGEAVRVHVGLGGAENLEKAIESVFKPLDGAAEKWTTEWFDFKFDMLYAYHLWSELDSKKKEVVRGQLDYLKAGANLGARFESDAMPESLRQKYLWLDAEAR